MMKVLLLLVALVLSAFFSGTETAFVSVSLLEVQVWLKRKISGARLIHFFSARPDRYLITTLIGTNVAVVTFTSFSTYYLQPYLNDFVILLFNSLFLLVIGEIIPKTVFRETARKILKYLAPPLLLFRWLFYPLTVLLSFVISVIMKISGQKEERLTTYFSKKDLEILLRESERVGTIDPGEGRIISRIFRLSKCRVKEVLVPRTEMVTLHGSTDIQKVREIFAESGLSRIPVIGETMDEIVGVVYAKDLLSKPKQLQEILREVYFVPQTVLCSELLNKMRAKHTTFAIALDEFGGTAGLVTLEDIVEELFGEINDEFDVKITRIKKVSENEWIVSGRTEIDFINDRMDWHLPKGNYETVSGMILKYLGRIPAEGEEIKIRDYHLTVLRADRKRIRFMKIAKRKPATGSP